ncbi:hypothetical protein ScPMuIL_013782 [Solemya velum]
MSPVFERMFNSDFKEKDANEIKLPRKSFELMQMLLLVAHPRIQKDLTVDNSMQLLPLAEEYQMDRIKEKCEACVRENLRNGARSRPDFFLRCLNLSERHNLMDIWELALDRCSSEKAVSWEVRGDRYRGLCELLVREARGAGGLGRSETIASVETRGSVPPPPKNDWNKTSAFAATSSDRQHLKNSTKHDAFIRGSQILDQFR